MISTKLVIDGTGHDAAVCNTILRKIPNAKIGKLGVLGEKPMWSEVGERLTVDATQEIYPGLIVAGMAANAATRAPRMGPIFGGMLLSGKKAANLAPVSYTHLDVYKRQPTDYSVMRRINIIRSYLVRLDF